jgi:UDP-N-acetylmuramoyl-L-alanyl-D-glutamate--2,6-diaminopimelate ligase
MVKPMRLGTLLEGIDVKAMIGRRDIEVTAVTTDSREVVPGSLFVAVGGVRSDGLTFAKEAVSKGAVAVVADRDCDDLNAAVVRVDNPRRAVSLLAGRFYGNPTERLMITGITGTNGKTTTGFLIKSLLESAGCKTGLIGTVRYDLGGELREPTHTTPDAVRLQGLFRTMVDRGLTHAVMEVSSHALAQERVAGSRFGLAVFTNLTQDHLDYHRTMEEYYRAKAKLFEKGMGRDREARPRAVINGDDPWGRRLWDEIGGSSPRDLQFGLSEGCAVTAEEIRSDWEGVRFTAVTPRGRFSAASPLLGRYNVYNLLSAVAAGEVLDLPHEAVRKGIARLSAVPGRFERVEAGQPFLVVVDYAHTEAALERLLMAARELSRGRLITLFGCGGDRDRGKRPKMGAVAARLSDRVVVTSDNPRTEDPMQIIREIEAGLPAGSPYTVIPGRREAIHEAIRSAQPGDTVVLAGKGHEDYQILGEKKIHFDDREAAREAIITVCGR